TTACKREGRNAFPSWILRKLSTKKVPPLDSEELFQQAHILIRLDTPAEPPQANLRRAISAAYYGLFHTIAVAAADMVSGEENRSTNRYDRAYRSVEHSRLRDLCKNEAARTKWGDDFRNFAEAVVQLQQAREDADYSCLLKVEWADAMAKIAAAENAVARFK